MSEAFERISQGLKEAIAHASGEEVKGVVVHTVETKNKSTPTQKQFTQRFVTENASIHT
jgi:hypothetical protein